MRRSHTFALIALVLLIAASNTRAEDAYYQSILVTNRSPSPPTASDPNLQGSWGIAFSTTGPVWVSDQAVNFKNSGAASVIKVSDGYPPSATVEGLVVGIANQNGALPNNLMDNGPTGIVNTNAPGIPTPSSAFQIGTNGKADFIFANLDGSISAWNGSVGSTSTIEAKVAGASFTGLAIGTTTSGAAQIYAADQNSNNIDVFNSSWKMIGQLTDPNAAKFPAGYAAFNVQTLLVNGTQMIFVTYANQNTGGGIVDEFTQNGVFVKTLINDTAGAHLDAPWGLAVAPAGWGQFGGDLLVGNNNANAAGLSEINAYNVQTGAFAGTLTLANGQPFSQTELWGIAFGNGGNAGSKNTLIFSTGGVNNVNGVIGTINSIPEPSSAVLGVIAVSMLAGGVMWRKARRVE
jgi:uncharacterized protein (TIGR03118 family)